MLPICMSKLCQNSVMKLRRLKQHKVEPPRVFETEFALEILKSDKLRVTILICVVASVVPVMLTLSVFSFEDFQHAFRGNFKSLSLYCLAGDRRRSNLLNS